MNQVKKKAGFGTALLSTAALMVAMMGGNALASVAAHENIILRGPDGAAITVLDGTTESALLDSTTANAFSMKATCGECHNGTNGLLSYDEIERHSYHAQLAANDQYGWNPWNPDGNKWESGPSPKGKNWVQGQGHTGAW